MNFRRYAPALAAVSLTLAVASLPVQAKTYVYKHADGTVWHTDITPAKVDVSKYQLIGIINTPGPRKRKKKTASNKKKRHVIRCGGEEAMARRAAPYVPLIDKLAREYSISKHLVMAVVEAESCFNNRAESSKGARGLMQLMPITARELGVRDAFNHEQNLRGGIRYLGKLSRRFDYNPKLTLAAYNAGPGNVEKYNGIPPFPETRAYVKKVMNKFQIYMQQEG